MGCLFCTPGVDATTLVVAGNDRCDQAGVWEICDRHLPVLKQALMFGHDDCTPSHQYMVALITDLETREESRWERDGIGEYTIGHLVGFLEPGTVSCEGCGRVCQSIAEATRCHTRHVQEAKTAAAEADAALQVRQQRKLEEKDVRRCSHCGLWYWPSQMKGGWCDDCSQKQQEKSRWWRTFEKKT